MKNEEKAELVNQLATEAMTIMVERLACENLSQRDREIALLSIATSVGASVCGTIGAWNDNDTAVINAAVGTLVRGIAESLAAYDEPVGEATWSVEAGPPRVRPRR